MVGILVTMKVVGVYNGFFSLQKFTENQMLFVDDFQHRSFTEICLKTGKDFKKMIVKLEILARFCDGKHWSNVLLF